MLKRIVVVSSTALILFLGAANAQQGKRAQSRIPVPSAALLKSQPDPACEYKADKVGRPDNPKSGDAEGDAAALRAKLDYERQCYRHTEIIVRQRLHALQASVRGTMRAIERDSQRKSRPKDPGKVSQPEAE